MRVVSYDAPGGLRAAVVHEDVLVDAEQAARAAGLTDAGDYATVRGLIAHDADALALLGAAVAETAAVSGIARDGVRLGPPVPDPDKIICVGLNYRDHADEAGMAVPEFPVLFSKYRNALIGDNEPFELSDVSTEWDYEAELGVVIGTRAAAVSESDALDYVAGYMPFNDISARDVQLRISQWTTGKAIDRSGPCGPMLVLTDEVPDPQALTVRLRLNGEVLQESGTEHMIFSVARLVSYISAYVTLEPGDVIATGTPAGVGFKRDPVVRLNPGDVLETEVDGIGILVTPMVAKTAMLTAQTADARS
jgi:2-keto-4-pentenoate hydratase/2-oxohepta-3-ene-1,7-dioic acid hydratase in catechol pathway